MVRVTLSEHLFLLTPGLSGQCWMLSPSEPQLALYPSEETVPATPIEHLLPLTKGGGSPPQYS